jgi:hypothetical protein
MHKIPIFACSGAHLVFLPPAVMNSRVGPGQTDSRPLDRRGREGGKKGVRQNSSASGRSKRRDPWEEQAEIVGSF